MRDGGFDVIIGNPPYVEWPKIKNYKLIPSEYNTVTCGNIYTTFCERSYKLMHRRGFFGIIVLISCISTSRMLRLREIWSSTPLQSYISLYSGDAHPSILFQGVKFRLAILLQTRARKFPIVFTTHFYRWWPENRQHLFSLLNYCPVAQTSIRAGLIPKIASSLHGKILDKLCALRPTLGDKVRRQAAYYVYCHRIVAHFVKAFDFVPFFHNERDGIKKSEDYKVFSFCNSSERDAVSALLNSNLAYLWFVTYSDVYHFGRELILDFPCNIDELLEISGDQLVNANNHLMKDLQNNSIRRQIPYRTIGIVEYDEFYPRQSKSKINKIDQILAKYFEFSDDELDFIIHYDVKFRLEE